jgi:hypothetical protein
MRKLLLASVAMLSGTVGLASVASAQLQTQYPYTAPTGSTPVSSPSFGTSIPTWTSNPPMVPSNITVRLAGRLEAFFAVGSDSGRNVSQGNTKLAGYELQTYARLYPSFDGIAANGLKYGAALEIRQDRGAPAGGGANGSISGSTATRGGLYFRREMGYLGSDAAGFVRFGSTDQPTSLFITGTFENFNDGGWNGDVPQFFTGNTIPTWPFADQGAVYTTTKVVYVSPKFFNLLDFGVSWEPNTGTVTGNSTNTCSFGNTVAGTSGCNAASSTSLAAESARRRNTLDAVARVRTAVGPVGLAATFGGMYSGTVAYNGFAAPSTGYFNGLAVLDAGAQVTFGGLAVGGHVTGGSYNGAYNLNPEGGRKALAYLVGASYAVGPAVFGASFYNFQSAGAWTRASGATGVATSRNEVGVAAGGTLTVAPGAFVFLSYLYGTRHQPGYNFVTGATTVAGGSQSHNDTRAQGIALGTQFRW